MFDICLLISSQTAFMLCLNKLFNALYLVLIELTMILTFCTLHHLVAHDLDLANPYGILKFNAFLIIEDGPGP